MIATSLRPSAYEWSKLSFASTLFLCPILDLLLQKIPQKWHPELRLGLQEALVNAAKHGNKLDPGKTVVVRFAEAQGKYWWVISDEGGGFCTPECDRPPKLEEFIPDDESECGRGLCILHQVFDQVEWNVNGTELRLCKQVKPSWLSQSWFKSNRELNLKPDSLLTNQDVVLG
ncbi:ATP-binding protein [Merismopedia glauca]|uniref:ATP-binding protein n=1 Tax=Merismopedia glauca CCAP 1448/3 TaxID=1296344 RepID=A0A2T1C2B7_9CYAN|nr:anti-sigma regulatory factor [Merismopedia glauca]PSB02263.1 ATP-binding protein [Merismopedia glauca CCAP 1448/3]